MRRAEKENGIFSIKNIFLSILFFADRVYIEREGDMPCS